MRISRRKRIVFALAAMALSFAILLGGLLAADVWLHKRAERSAGLNIWGYRGPLVGSKRPGEVRVVVLGGSTAFGYGVRWDQAIPALLEQELRARLPIGRATVVTVVNLGMNNEGAYSYPFTLRDFEFLDYDIVVLYEGYNDVTGTNRSVFRHSSPVFRLFGYYPLLPLAIDEKRLILLYGDIGTAYRAIGGEQVVFTPSPTRRAAAAALGAAEGVSEAVSRQLDRLAAAPEEDVDATSPESRSCQKQWWVYCDSTARAVIYSLERKRRVLIVAQPYFSVEHRQQQQDLQAMLLTRFHGRDGLTYVDLGEVLNVRDEAVTFDGMHLNPEGNARMARALAGAVAEAIAR